MKVYIGINGEVDICIDSEWIFSIDIDMDGESRKETHCIWLIRDYADLVVKELLKINASFRLISEEGCPRIEFDGGSIRITTDQSRI